MAWEPRYSKEQVQEAVAGLTQALRHLGLRPAGGNHATLRKLIAHYEISTAHFDPNWTRRAERRSSAKPLSEILVEESNYHRGHLKQRLYEEGIKSRLCELCGLPEEWQGRPISLILDHINGVPTDNRIENLRIVCPNCAATLETHCGRKNKIDREPRSCLRCGKKFVPKYVGHRYCSQICGVHSKGPRAPKPHTRKVSRPSYEQLKADLETMSFCAVGRKYGVLDNAIRKWLRWERDARARAEAQRAGAQRTEAPPPDTIAA
jgi:hypothetical protein